MGSVEHASAAARDWHYNEGKLLNWLYYYYELSQPATQSGVPGDVFGDSGGDSSSPLIGWVLSRMDDPQAWWSHKVLMAAVEELKRRRLAWYVRLVPAYFGSHFLEPNPNLPSIWEQEVADGAVGDKFALADHAEAIKFMLEYITQELPKYEEMTRLKVRLPQPVRGAVRRKQRRRRAAAIDVLCEVWDLMEKKYGDGSKQARSMAVKATAGKTGYSQKEVRSLARQLEGNPDQKAPAGQWRAS